MADRLLRLGRRIAALRTERTPKLSREDLARATGTSLANMHKNENGLRDMRLGEFLKICTVLAVDPCEILNYVLEREGATD
jgi:DNA-binding Xre family transcriptional regulator